MNIDTKKRPPIVLAFSGGLDTSYCVLELNAQGYEVHTVFVDTGGLSEDEVEWIEERANEQHNDTLKLVCWTLTSN